MRYLYAAALMSIAFTAVAATAFWTGKQEHVFTVTGKSAIRCQYDYNGQKFWRLFVERHICPNNIEVE